MSITVKQQWEEGESELEPSSNSQPIQSPREFSSVNAPTELLPIEANGPGLCAPTSNSYWMCDSLGKKARQFPAAESNSQRGTQLQVAKSKYS